LTVFSQAIVFTDSFNQPISEVKVLVTDDSDALLGIAYSNDQGRLAFDFKINTTYKIKTSHLSYEVFESSFSFSRVNEIKTIVLAKKTSELDEILIEAKKSIVKRGDTTIVDLKPFALPTDKTIDQVISRIPGMIVQKDGKISYKGKDVTDMLINGRKLFDQEYKDAISFINSSIVVELKVIEKYNDDKGFKTRDIKSQAIDLVYTGKNIYSGQVTGGVGNDNMYVGDYAHILANSLFSNYLKLATDNLGQSRFSIRFNPEEPIFNYSIISPKTANQSLNDVYGLFNQSFIIDSNSNIPIDTNEDNPITIKYSTVIEENDYLNTVQSTFFEDDELINRLEVNDRNLQLEKHTITTGYKKQSEKWYSNSSATFGSNSIHGDEIRSLNGQNIIEDNDYNVTHLLANSKLQFKKNEDFVYELELQLAHDVIEDQKQSIGFNIFDQTFKGESIALSSKVDIPFKRTKIFQLGYKSQFDFIHLDYDLERSESNELLFRDDEQIGIWSHQISGTFLKSKKFILNAVPQIFILDSENIISNINRTKIVIPTVQLQFKWGGTLSSFGFRNYYTRLGNRAAFLPQLFTSNTISQSVNNANPFSEVLDYSYNIRWGEFYNRTTLSASMNLTKNILISNYDFDEISTVSVLTNLDRTQRQIQLRAEKDFLILKKLSLKASLSWVRFSSFQASLDRILEFDNDMFSAEVNTSKRIGKKFFFRSATSLSQNVIQIQDSPQNEVLNFQNNITLDYATDRSEAGVELISNDYGSDELLHFLNLSYKYDLNKLDSQIRLRLINLFDNDEIVSESISPQINSRNAVQIQGRRFVVSWSYYF
jgi:hypothetical protein